MALFAIADLHLSFFNPKPMDIFGEIWKDHPKKIKQNWQNIIKKDDTVLIPGDISWAKNLTEFAHDMEFIRKLNGKKIFLCGNHDYWWDSVSKMNSLYTEIVFLKNNCYIYKNIAVCGCKGWCSDNSNFEEQNEKLLKRECLRLETSLKDSLKYNVDKIIVMMHFPPANNKNEKSCFIDIIKKYNANCVVYGHLHGCDGFNTDLLGIIDGIEYVLVSSDYLNFIPKKLAD